jgi:hypothetical protein
MTRDKLRHLRDAAPDLARSFFPFSNDDAYGSLKAALKRTETKEYRQAKLPVALLVGEAALAASLAHGLLPEPGIISLDNQPRMVEHMRRYAEILRFGETADSWRHIMGMDDHHTLSTDDQELYARHLKRQVELWESQGHAHPLGDQSAAYDAASDAVGEKTIIPWLADIARPADVAYLGEQLREAGATVTLLYLSNAIPYSSMTQGAPSFPTAAGYAELLSQLPITPNAPIITTSGYPTLLGNIAMATGPFWGLDDLANRGGNSQHGPVAMPPATPGREPLYD